VERLKWGGYTGSVFLLSLSETRKFAHCPNDEDSKAAAEANEECNNSSEETVGPLDSDVLISMR
jgi:hypothetical protein